MNMLSPAAVMCPVTKGASDEKYQGSHNIVSVLDNTTIGANATLPSSQCGNNIMENKSEISKSSSVLDGNNSTSPCSGIMIGSSMSNSVISEHKQSLASNTNKFQEDTNMSNSDDSNLSIGDAKSVYTEKSAVKKADKNTNGNNKVKKHQEGY